MKIEIWCRAGNEKFHVEADLPTLPRVGDCILVGESHNYVVEQGATWFFDSEGRYMNRVSIDAVLPRSRE